MAGDSTQKISLDSHGHKLGVHDIGWKDCLAFVVVGLIWGATNALMELGTKEIERDDKLYKTKEEREIEEN